MRGGPRGRARPDRARSSSRAGAALHAGAHGRRVRPRGGRGRRGGELRERRGHARMFSTKGILLAAPTLVSLFLLQSYFWVPTFEDQARGDPGRLTRFISTSIGDAVYLNPTISADSASSEINERVFDGLIDRDLDLSFRGRLAESWQIPEEAYLFADATLRLPDGTSAAPEALLARLRAAQAAGAPALRGVDAMAVLPAETRTVRIGPPAPARTAGRPRAGARPDRRRRPVPAAVKFTLRAVDQDFFANLDRLLGRVRAPARSPPVRHGAGPRDGPGGRRGARAADRGESGHRLPAAPRRALPRRARADRAGRALHIRDDHGPAEPLAPGAGLRADQGGGDPGPPHRPGDLQGALPARLRELGHGDPARAPAQPGDSRRRGPRGRQGPAGLQHP